MFKTTERTTTAFRLAEGVTGDDLTAFIKKATIYTYHRGWFSRGTKERDSDRTPRTVFPLSIIASDRSPAGLPGEYFRIEYDHVPGTCFSFADGVHPDESDHDFGRFKDELRRLIHPDDVVVMPYCDEVGGEIHIITKKRGISIRFIDIFADDDANEGAWDALIHSVVGHATCGAYV